jgi:GMP synthase-like glutamine amidotransferase
VATNTRVLVIENYPTDDPRLLGEWLGEAGLDLDVVRAHAGQPLPTELDGYAGLLVLGGAQHAFPGPAGEPGALWFATVESLLRKAVRHRVPTLGVCLGAQLLASAHAGTVAPAEAGPELGPNLVAKRDAADRDPLFGPLPMLPDVVQWHFDDVTELPLGAVLLATSTYHPVQAFRVGECAWGIQFHVEADAAMVADWAAADALALAEVGLDAEAVVARVNELADDLFEVWQPFAARFAALVRGDLAAAAPTGRELPLLGR